MSEKRTKREVVADNLVITIGGIAAATVVVCGWFGVQADPAEVGTVLLGLIVTARAVQSTVKSWIASK